MWIYSIQVRAIRECRVCSYNIDGVEIFILNILNEDIFQRNSYSLEYYFPVHEIFFTWFFDLVSDKNWYFNFNSTEIRNSMILTLDVRWKTKKKKPSLVLLLNDYFFFIEFSSVHHSHPLFTFTGNDENGVEWIQHFWIYNQIHLNS